ncbi:unnamed protein product [Calypogeia fissa]
MAAGRAVFLDKVQVYAVRCQIYEDPSAQAAALKTVNFSEIEENALVDLARKGKLGLSQDELERAKLHQLCLWFKNSFKWVNQPSCEKCGGDSLSVGAGIPNHEELKWLASRVELYRCKMCFSEVRFPRYNDPRKLLETRRGRCGEWANCFTLYCRALGYRARLILDFTDHVWTECYLPGVGRWVHTDPCDGVIDEPLLYEQGWKKKLSYIIALSHNGVRDVTKRYTRQWSDVLRRRNLLSEVETEELLMMLNLQMRSDVSSEEWDELATLDAQEDAEIKTSYLGRDPPHTEKQLPGRQSGSEEWRVERGENGDSVDSKNSNSRNSECPVRSSVDEHVTNIREAVGSLCSDVTGSDYSVEKLVLSLKGLHSFLVKLKSQPFRTRKLKLDYQTEGAWLHQGSDETISLLLQALSLVASPQEDGETWVVVDGDPVHTALALPVALELLERLVKDVPSEVTLKWLEQGSRVCKGVACASREDEPVGISLSAFDGLHSTKWEEPNGSKGAWIVYHLSDGNRQTVAAYELTSANDFPSRDPTAWVVEGSDNNGRSWRTLDSQKGQLFERRFLSKTYEIDKKNHLPCDSFRLRFLSTRNPAVDDRLQLGCIDLIASKV